MEVEAPTDPSIVIGRILRRLDLDSEVSDYLLSALLQCEDSTDGRTGSGAISEILTPFAEELDLSADDFAVL